MLQGTAVMTQNISLEKGVEYSGVIAQNLYLHKGPLSYCETSVFSVEKTERLIYDTEGIVSIYHLLKFK